MTNAKDRLLTGLEQDLKALPMIDCHTHLNPKHLSSRGLHDILLYHMAISELHSAGCPIGTRLSDDADEKEITNRIEEALPFLDKVMNTSIMWGIRIILSELYDWHEPITSKNWRKLHAIIGEHAAEASWPRKVMRNCNVIRASTEWFLRGDGSYDDLFDYSLEWAFFSRTQQNQNDIPLYELENTWQMEQASPALPVTLKNRPSVAMPVNNVEDVHAAVEHYCRLIPYGKVVSTAQHISTDIDYRKVSEDEMAETIRNRQDATTYDRDIYASYILRAFLEKLEKHGREIVYQFSLGAEPVGDGTGSRLAQKTIQQLGEIIASCPRLHFQCMLASRHGNQSLCTLARELPNLSLAGYWWHNFFPDIIRQIISERLDMLPINKQVGFFSDAYCVEWQYAKAKIVRRILAESLAEKICRGQYSYEQAVAISGYILKDTAEQLLGMKKKSH